MISLDIQHVEPVQQQLERLIREKILRGEIPVGTRLPVAAKWAKELGTSYPALHAALNNLAQEGLIDRRRRAGSFVRSNQPVQTRTVGIYCAQPIWQMKDRAFMRAVHASLSARLKEEGLSERVWVDGRQPEDQGSPLPELVSAVKNGEIQSLFVLLASPTDLPWLKTLPIPSSFVSSGNVPNRIAFDFRELFALSLDHLKSKGCRTVGCISGAVPGQSEKGFMHPMTEFYEDFVAAASERGLSFRNSWVLSPTRESDIINPELWGYIQAQKLLEESELPDGLVIFPDEMALGSVRVLVDRFGAHTPFQLVTHCNAGTGLLFPPIETAWIGNDKEAVVDGMLRQISEQVKTGKTQPVYIPFKFRDAPCID